MLSSVLASGGMLLGEVYDQALVGMSGRTDSSLRRSPADVQNGDCFGSNSYTSEGTHLSKTNEMHACFCVC